MTRRVDIEVRRDPGPIGAGGGDSDYQFDAGGATETVLEDIPTRGGPGSFHWLSFSAKGYLDSSFGQFIEEGEKQALQQVYMVLNPKKGATIAAPAFERLPKRLQTWLGDAEMIAAADEDEDLLEKNGADLYNALGPRRKAAVLNIFRKATHPATVGEIWDFIGKPMLIRSDRCFAQVDAGLRQYVANDPRFVVADPILHKPLKGYKLSNSVKSDDHHANIQLTFQQDRTGSWAADIDIDEHSGFAHWGEVLRNFFANSRTNPYAIHELLLAADLSEHTLDPGYDLILA